MRGGIASYTGVVAADARRRHRRWPATAPISQRADRDAAVRAFDPDGGAAAVQPSLQPPPRRLRRFERSPLGVDAAVGDAGRDRRLRIGGQAELDAAVRAAERARRPRPRRVSSTSTPPLVVLASIAPETSRATTPPLVVSAVMRPARPVDVDAAVDRGEFHLRRGRHLHRVLDLHAVAVRTSCRCARSVVTTRTSSRDASSAISARSSARFASSGVAAACALHRQDLDLLARRGLDVDLAVDVADLDPSARRQLVAPPPLGLFGVPEIGGDDVAAAGGGQEERQNQGGGRHVPRPAGRHRDHGALPRGFIRARTAGEVRARVAYLNRSSKALRALVGAGRFGFALDRRPRLVERAGVAGVFRRDPDRHRLLALERRAGVENARTARSCGDRCRSSGTSPRRSRPRRPSARSRSARSGRPRGSRAC